MFVAVLIPWRSANCPDRDEALHYVLGRYAREYPAWQVTIGRSSADGPWIKARAVADALAQTAANTLVIADADVWSSGLGVAVERTISHAAWAIPHRGVHRLTAAGTVEYVQGAHWEGLELAERAYLGTEAGGLVVVRRAVYEACPLDPRFEGWGSEDDAWGMALRTLYGPPWRGRAELVHLWHPPPPRATRSWGSLAGRSLRKRYAHARHSEAAMRTLLAEHTGG